MDRKYKICFEDESVQQSYKVLLQHECSVCKDQLSNNYDNGKSDNKMTRPLIFSTFKQLETHVRREHEMFYCDLCSDHLKVRPSKKLIRMSFEFKSNINR